MRRIFIPIFTLLTSCASVPKSAPDLISFDSVKNLVGEKTSEQDVEKKFGRPSSISKDGPQERWSYVDKPTGFSRVQMVFSTSGQIKQLFWYPLPGEEENKIDKILARYPKEFIKPISVRAVAPPHDLNTETTYADPDSMSILFDDYNKEVETVFWYRLKDLPVENRKSSTQ